MRLTRRKPRRAPYSETSWALALSVAAVVCCASYSLQRLFSLVSGEPEPGTVIAIGHTPYYWRVGISLLHAVIALSIAKLAIGNDRAEDILRFAPLWVPCLVLPFALAMVGLP